MTRCQVGAFAHLGAHQPLGFAERRARCAKTVDHKRDAALRLVAGHGVQTVGDLVQKSESELNAIPNFGRKSIEEVKETLEARGLNLRHG